MVVARRVALPVRLPPALPVRALPVVAQGLPLQVPAAPQAQDPAPAQSVPGPRCRPAQKCLRIEASFLLLQPGCNVFTQTLPGDPLGDSLGNLGYAP